MGFNSRKYTVDTRFFAKINNEQKAYWLGFVSADGCITDTTLSFALARRDREHLIKLKSSLSSEHPIKDVITVVKHKEYPQSQLQICSTELISDLETHGLHRHKSASLKPANNLPEELARHYWRGLLDGDGSISIHEMRDSRTGKARQIAYVRLCGSKPVVFAFTDYVRSFFRTRSSPTLNGHSLVCWTVGFGGIQLPQRIIALLYSEASIYLDRKRDSALEVLRLERKYHRAIVK